MNKRSPVESSPIAFSDEDAAVAYFTAIRWKNGPRCPYCHASRIYHFADRRTHRCASCRRKFTIRAGTIFEDSRLSLKQWLEAIQFVTSSDGTIASTDLAVAVGVTQKTAWLMLQRLRRATTTKSFKLWSILPDKLNEELLL